MSCSAEQEEVEPFVTGCAGEMRKYVCSVLVERGSQLRGFVYFGESLGSFGISHESHGTPALLYLSTAGSAGIILAVASFDLRCESFIVLPAREVVYSVYFVV